MNCIILCLVLILISIIVLFGGNHSDGKGRLTFTFGYSPTIVVTGSMVPVLEVNSLNIVKEISGPEEFNKLKVGDIVVYWNSEKGINVIHRLIREAVDLDGNKIFISKGDSNSFEDEMNVSVDNIEGKVVYTNNYVAKYLEKVTEGRQFNELELLKYMLGWALTFYFVIQAAYIIIIQIIKYTGGNKHGL